MLSFIFDALPAHVILGIGSLQKLKEEVDRKGASRVLVLSTPQQRETPEDITAQFAPRLSGYLRAPSCICPSRSRRPRESALRTRRGLPGSDRRWFHD